MGLGKSLSALSLICHYLDHIQNIPSTAEASKVPKTTLIVAPMSSTIPHKREIMNEKLTTLAIHGWQIQIERFVVFFEEFYCPNWRN